MNKVVRFLKVLFASYAAAVGMGIAGILIGLILIGTEQIDSFIENYIMYALIILTIVIYPFMNRKLK